jgi:hypothetical protein
VDASPPAVDISTRVLSARWALAAAARIGTMWSDVERIFRPPRPTLPELTLEDIGDTAENALVRHAIEAHAREAFEVCLQLAELHLVASPMATACESWLAQKYPFEYVWLEEFVPAAPSWGDASTPTSRFRLRPVPPGMRDASP